MESQTSMEQWAISFESMQQGPVEPQSLQRRWRVQASSPTLLTTAKCYPGAGLPHRQMGAVKTLEELARLCTDERSIMNHRPWKTRW